MEDAMTIRAPPSMITRAAMMYLGALLVLLGFIL